MKSFKNISIAFAYILICLGTYGWFLGNPFILDDELQILENTHIQSLNNLPTFFTSSSMGSGGAEEMTGIYYKPLMSTYYALMWNFFGNDPSGYRLPLFILHALSAFFIFLISLNFFKAPAQRHWSFVLGLLFLLHPINTEVVLYLADAQDILYLFFGLLSLIVIMQVEQKWLLSFCLLLTFSAGLLSKETGALFLGIGTAYAFLFQNKKWPLVLAASTFVFLSYLAIRISIGLTETESPQLLFHNADYLTRISMMPMIFYHYLEIFFFPWRLSVSSDFLLSELTLTTFWGPLAVCLLALLSLFALGRFWIRRGESKEFSFFVFILFLWFILHSHVFIPLDGIYADRWLYLISWMGLSLLLMTLQRWLLVKPKIYLKCTLGIGLIFIFAFAWRSFARGQDWSDPLTFYQREARLHPQDAVMNNNVGAILFRKGFTAEASSHFEKATLLNPIWGVAWNNLAACFEASQNEAMAEKYYLKAISLQDYPLAFENYAKLLYRNRRAEDLKTFLNSKALPKLPNNKLLLAIKDEIKNW